MRKISLLLVLFFILSLKTSFANSDIVINEFSALSDPDWIEIYNKTSDTVNIDGWVIRDSTQTNKIDLSGYICPNSFRKFDFSNRLNNGGDTIKLLDSESSTTPVDEITYFSTTIPTHQDGQSTSRQTSGSDNWQVLTSPTPQNDESCFPQPSPTPSPTPSPSSSPSPTPKTASPTTVASKLKSPSPTPLKNSATSASPSSSPEVLGEKDLAQGFVDLAASDVLNSQSPEMSTYQNLNKNFSKILIGAGAIFIFLSFGLYLWYKRSLGLTSGINKGNERFEQKEE